MDAEYYGFSPDNNGEQNAIALNKATETDNDIFVSRPGVYDIADTVFLRSGNSIRFGEGVTLRRIPSKNGDNGNLFINIGAFTGEYDKDISISGLHLLTNAVECLPPEAGGTKTITGLRGHIAFMYAKNIRLEGITIADLSSKDYAIQISDFYDAEVVNCRLEGLKDGVHFGPGKKFAVRNCHFRTYDDAIALNCFDYSTSNPNCGSIEDGIIENCFDLKGIPTEAFFLRILVGGWKNWEKGMKVYHSDAVVHNGRLYRVVMRPDNESYISLTPPTHEDGFCELDGIRWVRTHKGYGADDLPHTASCRNITVRNVVFMKPRNIHMLIYASYDEYVRSYHRGNPMPEVTNIVFENLQVHCETEYIASIRTKTDPIVFKNCFFGESKINQDQNTQMTPYEDTKIVIEE